MLQNRSHSKLSHIRNILKNISISFWSFWEIIFKGWHIRNFLNLSNLLKIAFLYIACIIWVILIDFDTSKNFWSNSANRLMNKIIYFGDVSYNSKQLENRYAQQNNIISNEAQNRRISIYSISLIGESLLYDRMIEYAKDNGYEYTGCRFWENIKGFRPIEHIYYVAASFLNFLLEPDFNLTLTHHVNIVPRGYNVTYLNMPRHDLFSPHEKFLPNLSHLNKYDAYLDLYTLSHGHNEILEKVVQAKPIIPIYLAERKIKYKEVRFDKALITGSLWGCARGSIRIMLALEKLAKDGLLESVGAESYEYLGKYYLGRIESLIKRDTNLSYVERSSMNLPDIMTYIQSKYGIGLLIHNSEHMIDGVPTARLAETVGSSSIIISDRNRFIEKYFGDSVLFFDIEQSESGIYNQIKMHINWIKDNPEIAKSMARKSSEIFADNFSIDIQMEILYSALAKIL